MSNKSVFIIFPHQLFNVSYLPKVADEYVLIEEALFFNQYNFHKSKLVFHRASMKCYESYLMQSGLTVRYVTAQEAMGDIRVFISKLFEEKCVALHTYTLADDWLHKRVVSSCSTSGISLQIHQSPYFLNSDLDFQTTFSTKEKLQQTSFYIVERKKRGILLDTAGKPVGGKWTYDVENRKKIPSGTYIPSVQSYDDSGFIREAKEYVSVHYSSNVGSIDSFVYPISHDDAVKWLDKFLEERFLHFGVYEDAIQRDGNFLFHSVLSPLINSGLLTPKEVVDKALGYALNHNIPIASLEGFVRQIIGWREYMYGVYLTKGVQQRTSNYWNFSASMPDCIYSATTGIAPIDTTIKKLLATSYNHHIERLMLLGNFMLLCEIHPNEVYRWFMELYIDAYDWVMVPNIYGMSQFADGGMITGKPYISSSNYVLKMSDYSKGAWCSVWDGLFWRFMNKQREFFLSNPRLGMLIKTYDKMSAEQKNTHLKQADDFLNKLHA